MLELRGVAKQYLYGARLFGALDLTVGDGEIIAVYGGPKSGKTSLLKVVAGVEEREGEILLDGKPLSLKTDDVIMVFDDGAVFGSKSVFDNLAYPLTFRKVDKAEIAARVIAAAEAMGIGSCLRAKAKRLSLAERKRMSAARILLREARLILVDDVSFGLPRQEAESLWRDLSETLFQRAASGASVLYSTSDFGETSLGERIIVLQAGEVKQIGTLSELWSRPQSIWAAQAADSYYNFAKAVLICRDGALKLDFGDQTLDCQCLNGRFAETYIGREVLAGWHPRECGAGAEEAVRVAFHTPGGRLCGTRGGLWAYGDGAAVCALPADADGVTLYDASNEYSIMR